MPTNPHNDELLSAYLDGELTAAERAEVERRLAEDPTARQALEELRGVSETLRGLPVRPAEAGFAAGVMQRVEAAGGQRDSSQSAGPVDAERTTERESLVRLPFGRSPRSWIWAGLAVAAALVVMVNSQPEDEARNVAAIRKPAAEAQEGPLEISALPAIESRDEGLPASEIRRELPRSGGEELADALIASEEATIEASEEEMLAAEPLPESGPAPAPASVAAPLVTAVPPPVSRFTFEASQPTEGTPPQLVVLVQLRPEAYRNNFVDALLKTQGIAVENVAAARVPMTPDGSRNQPGLASDASQNQPRGAIPSRTRSASPRLSLPADESSDLATSGRAPTPAPPASETDLLVVDAPAAQLAACLNELKNDSKNCISVFVCPTDQPTSPSTTDGEAASKPGRAAKALPSGGGVGGAATMANRSAQSQPWQIYNRAAPAPEQHTPKGESLLQFLPIQNTQQNASLPRAYRLQGSPTTTHGRHVQTLDTDALRLGELRQQAASTRGPTPSLAASLPPPTDPATQVQALLICEPQEPPAAAEQ